jgi:hypothetical protein
MDQPGGDGQPATPPAPEAALDDDVERPLVGDDVGNVGEERVVVGLAAVGQQSFAQSDRHCHVGDVLTQVSTL